MNQSTLQTSLDKRSPLAQAQFLRFGGSAPTKRHGMSQVVLPLTSLIDAFAIIVIYLLVGSQNSGVEINTPERLQLPTAQSGYNIEETPTLIVRIDKGVYYVNDKAVNATQLGARLAELRKAEAKDGIEATELLIQADHRMNYADLDPLLRAGSEAGIQKLKFAVLPQP